MKHFLISLSIVVSIGLFVLFIFGLQKHVNPRPPGITYSLELQGKGNSIVVLTYQQPDSTVTKKEDPKSSITQQGAPTTVNQKEAKLTPYESVNYGPRIIAFNRNPKLMLWILTFSLMVSVSFALFAGFISQMITLISNYKVTSSQWIANVVLGILFALALCYFNLDGDDNRTFLPPFDIICDLNAMFDREVFNWIYPGEIVAFTVAGVAFCGTFLLNSVVGNGAKKRLSKKQKEAQRKDGGGEPVKPEKLDKATFLILKADLDHYLVGFSILIVFAILTISFLNQALITHFVNIEKLQVIRSEFIFAYGFVFSSLLALIYIPINQRLRSMTAADALDNGGNDKNMFQNNFLSFLSILAPLASSGVSEMIKAMSS